MAYSPPPPRTLVPLEFDLPSEYGGVLSHLQQTFANATLFGGCITDAIIGRRPIHDIDAHTTLGTKTRIPSELLRRLDRRESHNTWVNADDADRRQFLDWTGLSLLRYMKQEPFYRFTCFASDIHANTEIDLSVYIDPAQHNNAHRPFAHSPLQRCSTSFTSVALDRTGLWGHERFERSVRDMSVHIFRDRGLKAVIWTIPYFEHMRKKYPDLTLDNIEARLYSALFMKTSAEQNRVSLNHTPL